MTKNIMILAAMTSFVALTAPNHAAVAQGAPETLEEFKERCRAEDAGRGWGEGLGYIDHANVMSRQANDFRQLEQSARDFANSEDSQAGKDFWNAEADRRADRAKKLEEEARRNLELGKLAFAKFRAHASCTDIFTDFMDDVIYGGELRTDPGFYDDWVPMKEETRAMIDKRNEAEAEKIEKAEPTPRQEKKKRSVKKPPKTEKTKKQAHVKKTRSQTQDAAQSIARDVFVNVASQLIVGQITGMDHKREKHHKNKHHKSERRKMIDGMAMEGGKSRRKMKTKMSKGASYGMF